MLKGQRMTCLSDISSTTQSLEQFYQDGARPHTARVTSHSAPERQQRASSSLAAQKPSFPPYICNALYIKIRNRPVQPRTRELLQMVLHEE